MGTIDANGNIHANPGQQGGGRFIVKPHPEPSIDLSGAPVDDPDIIDEPPVVTTRGDENTIYPDEYEPPVDGESPRETFARGRRNAERAVADAQPETPRSHWDDSATMIEQETEERLNRRLANIPAGEDPYGYPHTILAFEEISADWADLALKALRTSSDAPGATPEERALLRAALESASGWTTQPGRDDPLPPAEMFTSASSLSRISKAVYSHAVDLPEGSDARGAINYASEALSTAAQMRFGMLPSEAASWSLDEGQQKLQEAIWPGQEPETIPVMESYDPEDPAPDDAAADTGPAAPAPAEGSGEKPKPPPRRTPGAGARKGAGSATRTPGGPVGTANGASRGAGSRRPVGDRMVDWVFKWFQKGIG